MKKLLLLLSIFFCINAVGQQYDSTRIRQRISAYGYDYNNIKIYTLVFPSDTPRMAIADTGAAALIGNTFFVWRINPTLQILKWDTAGGSGSGLSQNFANADLDATGNRSHNFKNFALAIDSLGSFETYSYSGQDYTTFAQSGASVGLQYANSGLLILSEITMGKAASKPFITLKSQDDNSTYPQIGHLLSVWQDSLIFRSQRNSDTTQIYFGPLLPVGSISDDFILSQSSNGRMRRIPAGSFSTDDSTVILMNSGVGGFPVLDQWTNPTGPHFIREHKAGLFMSLDSITLVGAITHNIDTGALHSWMSGLGFASAGDTLKLSFGPTGVTTGWANGTNTLFLRNLVAGYGIDITKRSDSGIAVNPDTTELASKFYVDYKFDLAGSGASPAGWDGSIQFRDGIALGADENSKMYYYKSTGTSLDTNSLWIMRNVMKYEYQPGARLNLVDSNSFGNKYSGMNISNIGTGDAIITMFIGSYAAPTASLIFGIDNSDADKIKIGAGATMGSGGSESGITITQADLIGLGTTSPVTGSKVTINRPLSLSAATYSTNTTFMNTVTTPGLGIGIANEFQVSNGSSVMEAIGKTGFQYTNLTSGSEQSKFILSLDMTSTLTDVLVVEGGVVTTTNSTPTTVLTITIPDETAGVLEVTIVGRETGTAGRVTGVKRIAYDKNGGTLTLGTATASLPDEATGTISSATWTVTTSSNNIIVQVTGVSATILWKSSVNQVSN